MATFEQLTSATEQDLAAINFLIKQLSERLRPCPMTLLEKIVTDPNIELWVVREAHRIIGMATLAIIRIPEGERGQLEDIVVDENQRGKGLGEQLSKKLIERARIRGVSVVTLSSRSDRISANKLYQKLGFEQRETNVYRLQL